jgi:ATP-dependent Clp protease protease subunit
MARTKTDLENYLVYGVDEKYRRVYFGVALSTADNENDTGAVSQCSIEYAIRAIERMASEYPKTPIEIHMNSYGGDPYSMLALYDVIQSASCQIKFFGKGAIMSAATWILSGCDERNLYPNTTVMVHAGWEEQAATFWDFKISAEEAKRLQNKLEEIYEENSRMPKDFWSEVCKRDLFLTAEEAVFLGLADKIITPKKRGNLRKVRESHLSVPVDQKKMSKLIDKLFTRIHVKSNIELKMNTHIPEPIDESLTIEENPLLELKKEEN